MRRLFEARYTVVISPHHPSRPITFIVGFPKMAIFFMGIIICGVLGLTALTQGSKILYTKTQEKILKEKIKSLAHEVLEMRHIAHQTVLLERDLKFLLSKNDPRSVWRAPVSSAREPNTLGDLLVGKIGDCVLDDVKQEKNQLFKHSKRLMGLASIFLTEEHNLYRRELSLPTDAPAMGALTSSYGWREHPFYSSSERDYHGGIDLANIEGTPIRAAADGVVRKASWLGSYGRTVILDHGFGFSTLYGHASKIGVADGDFVHRGEVIAYMGSTGHATGSHLHFEIWRHGKAINPLQVVSLENITPIKNSYAQNASSLGIGGSSD